MPTTDDVHHTDRVTSDRIHRLARLFDGAFPRQLPGEHLPSPFTADRVAASSIQQRLWFLEQFTPQLGAYHVPLVVRMRGALDVDALSAALMLVATRHEALRTSLVDDRGRLVQRIHPPAPIDLRERTTAVIGDAEAAFTAYAATMMRAALPLEQAPPWRVALQRRDDHDHCLTFVFHHAIVDGWSLDVLMADLAAAYTATRAGGMPPREPALQYGEIAAWQHVLLETGGFDRDLDYWAEHLAGAAPSLGRGVSAAGGADLPAGGVVRSALADDTARRLAALRAESGASTFIVGVAAWSAWLAARFDMREVLIAAPMSGRSQPLFADVIGPVVNTVPLRLHVDRAATFMQLVEQAARIVGDARAHQHAPLERVLERAGAHLTRIGGALPSPAFARERRTRTGAWADLEVTPLRVDHPAVKTDLALSVLREEQGWTLTLEHSARMLSAEAAADALHDFRSFVDDIAAAPATPLRGRDRQPATVQGDVLPLTPVQTRIWIDQQRSPDVPLYNVAVTLYLDGALDEAAFARAFARLVRSADTLRLAFDVRDGVPCQRVDDRITGNVATLDLTRCEPAECEARILADAQRAFDMRGPLFRATLATLPGGAQALLLVQHHLVTDGWTTRLLLERLSGFYEDECRQQSRPDHLPSFAGFVRDSIAAEARSTGDGARHKDDWWRRQFADAAPLQWRGRPAHKSTTRVTRTRVAFDAELRDGFRAAAARLPQASEAHGAFLLAGAALAVMLHRTTAERTIAFGVPTHNRRSDQRDIPGLLMTVLPVAVECRPGDTFAAIAQRLNTALRTTLRHSRTVPPEDVRARTCDVLLNVQVTAIDRFCGVPARIEWVHTGHERESLTIEFHDLADGRFGIDVKTHDEVFDAAGRQQLVDQLLRTIRAAVADLQAPIGDALLMDPAEWQRAMAATRGPSVPEAPMVPAIDRILQQAAAGDRAALVAGRDSITYRDLADRIRRVAGGLRDRGIGRGSLVALLLDRSIEAVSTALGALAAGAAYLPLDPAWPAARIQTCLDTACADLVVTTAAGDASAAGLVDSQRTPLVTADALRAGAPMHALPRRAADDLAYVIFTSGSTGVPNGVEIVERGLANYVAYAVSAFGLQPGDRVLQFASLAFDTSVEEILPTLAAGATLVLRDDEMLAAPATFADRLAALGITVLNLPTSYWHDLVTAAVPMPACVRLTLVGGDAVRADALRAWRELASGSRLLNGYGPTEATVVTTFADLSSGDGGEGPVNIGTPIWNAEALVLDGAGQIAARDQPGELFIGGAGLARGYRNNPDLTERRFVPHPFEQSGRLYRTGDLVRRRSDGSLEFLRRVDDQIKIRGYRVDPGEIAAALRSDPSVADAVVLGRADGSERIAAYLVPATGAALDAVSLRAHLRTTQPEHHLPTEMFAVAEVPRSSSGKVDRLALQARAIRLDANAPAEAPRTDDERRVAAVWRTVLGRDDIGIHDNFFDSGGQSLLAMQLAARLSSECGVTVSLRAIFERPTVAALAETIAALRSAATANVDRVTRERTRPVIADRAARNLEPKTAPASPAQRRLWIAATGDPTSAAYNLARAIEVDGRLNVEALRHAIEVITERHDALRTAFTSSEGRLLQVVSPPAAVPLEIVETPTASQDQESLDAALRAESRRPFDLATPPLCRWRLFRAPERDVLCLTLHHLICDGWSLGILGRELLSAYEAYAGGRRPEWRDLPMSILDATAGGASSDIASDDDRHRADAAEGTRFWGEMLRGLPEHLPLPFDRPRPARRSGLGGRVTRPAATVTRAAAMRLAADERTTPFAVYLSALAHFLRRWSGTDDIPIATPVALRDRPGLEGVVGLFVDTVLTRFRLDAGDTLRGTVRAARTQVLDAVRHQPQFFAAVDASAARPDSSLFQVLFAHEPQTAGAVSTSGNGWHTHPVHTGTAKCDLAVFIAERDDGLDVVFEYNSDRFGDATVSAAVDAFVTMLDAMTGQPDAAAATTSWLSAERRAHLVALGRGQQTSYPRGTPLHQLFFDAAARSPHASAVEDETGSITFGDLAVRARVIASGLRATGVAGGDRVVLLLPRGGEFVAAAIAIVSVGAAYVPIDPSYPPDRIRTLLEPGVAAILADRPASFETGGVPWIDLTQVAGPATADDAGAATADSPAYVMYTSGSTGTAKGVVVPHRAVARLVLNTDYCRIEPQDRVVFAANTAFDASTFEIWGALLNGATLITATADEIVSPRLLSAFLRDRRASVLFVTTAVFNRIAAEAPDSFATLRVLLFGGEAASAPAVRRVREHCPHTTLVNVYGPTESTTFATAHTVATVAADMASVPIGRPIANTSAYLLDAALQLVPRGVVGELFLAGDGVALGYLHQDAATAAAFLANPLEPGSGGERWYRTGDRCRVNADGLLEFVGRGDRQVKLRGFRIEPAEVEAALNAHPLVTGSIVALVGEGEASELVACATVSSDAVESEALRRHLAAVLPPFAVPSRIAIVEALPLTANGKLDRSHPALLAGQIERRRQTRAPRDPLEAELARIWEEVLGVAPIGRDDNFFELGGHSLLAAAMIDRVETLLGRRVPLSSLMRDATIEALATAYWEAEAARGSALVPVRTEGDRPPLFFAHGDLNGAGLYCARLAKQLHPEQPFYTLSPIGLQTPAAASSIEGMADEYAALISRVRPHGPVALGGYCHGALVAFEVARRLSAERDVTTVLMIHPSPIESRLVAVDRLVRAIGRLRGRDRIAHTRTMVRVVTALQLLRHATAAELRGWMWRKVTRTVRRAPRREDRFAIAPESLRSARHDPLMWETVVRAVMTYAPRRYDGAVSLLVPPAHGKPRDHGWARFARRVEVITIPGDHRTCVTTHADTLGHALESQLAATARATPPRALV